MQADRRVTGFAPLAALLVAVTAPVTTHAFCGFYVAKADASLWNEASQVAIVRDGELTEFALVVPVPAVLHKEQSHVSEREFIERLDAFSAPRLVEYFDPNPCQPPMPAAAPAGAMMRSMAKGETRDERARALGVSIEAEYTVGEYDIVILGAKESTGLETSNYRTVKVPSEMDLPVHVKDEFKRFFPDLFRTAWDKEGQNTVFLEYFWDMGWCDPCAADPLTHDELKEPGVFWLDGAAEGGGRALPQAVNALLTRLHVRYDDAHFPEDLMFQETADRENFQGRYVLRHPFAARADCEAGRQYREQLRERSEQEAQTLARLTGWPIDDIRKKIDPLPGDPGGAPKPVASPAQPAATPTPADSWWKRIWK